jgi:hypothetical protein
MPDDELAQLSSAAAAGDDSEDVERDDVATGVSS